jgi:hypothetical protein
MMQGPYDEMVQNTAQEWSRMPPRKKTPAPKKASLTDPYLHTRLDRDQMRRVKQLALDEDCNLTQLVIRGLDVILKSRKLPPL